MCTSLLYDINFNTTYKVNSDFYTLLVNVSRNNKKQTITVRVIIDLDSSVRGLCSKSVDEEPDGRWLGHYTSISLYNMENRRTAA